MDKRRKNPLAVGLAKLAVAAGGPSKGGKARALKLTPEERRESARKAVLARWAKAKKPRKVGRHGRSGSLPKSTAGSPRKAVATRIAKYGQMIKKQSSQAREVRRRA